MKRTLAVLFLSAIMGFSLMACGEEPAGEDPEPTASTVADEVYEPVIEPADFVATIDNPFLPFKPGSTWIYEGDTGEGSERIEVTVTSETKEILGVTCTVVRDRVWIDGELAEDTLDWYAQDRAGNVWYFGEDSKEIDGGEVVSTEGSWEAGVDGARPGIVMYAEPQAGGESYRQEYYEGEAEDMAKVLSVTASVEVAYGSYEQCLQTEEWSPLEPGVREHKFYSRGIGLLLEEMVEGGDGRIELTEYRAG